MLKFLANDFELDRWKMAAMKNAYALLSKQRYGEFLALQTSVTGLSEQNMLRHFSFSLEVLKMR
jgi:hypothetical protein